MAHRVGQFAARGLYPKWRGVRKRRRLGVCDLTAGQNFAPGLAGNAHKSMHRNTFREGFGNAYDWALGESNWV